MILIYNAMAVIFFSIVQNTPKKAIVFTAIVGVSGYGVFHFICNDLNSDLSAYFAAALVIALLSEASARILKMPSVIFVTPAIVPIVPGRGLFSTILYMTQTEYMKAAETGATTMLALAAMAMAIALAAVLVRATANTLQGGKGS